MKRTGEIVLGIIGIVINVIMIGGAILLNVLFQDEAVLSEVERELNNDPDLAAAGMDAAFIMDVMSSLGWGFAAIVAVSTILSIISVVVLRGNRKPKLAGGLFIGSALLVGLGTLLFGWLPALLFLIAGIMCFARKPKQADPFEDEGLRPL
ncbi:DUF4064 domain-containing protein [Jeotgalibacillus soli]|uniref:DUF4064 domain-containing protein n=1 Tax=Jeotgalibacillus soli TaxID=889306 RepID=A0A0C2VT50_9BACL|nr:DUF4064 domain-containing protein [Jeotgalibacillus soli]KIL52102.1 hypothetical protein KP78_04720 [Jeotgalibacillus soli]